MAWGLHARTTLLVMQGDLYWLLEDVLERESVSLYCAITLTTFALISRCDPYAVSILPLLVGVDVVCRIGELAFIGWLVRDRSRVWQLPLIGWVSCAQQAREIVAWGGRT